jgi:hypothetical protein
MNRSKITLNYFQGRFWIHLLTTLSLFIEFEDFIIIKTLFLVRLQDCKNLINKIDHKWQLLHKFPIVF